MLANFSHTVMSTAHRKMALLVKVCLVRTASVRLDIGELVSSWSRDFRRIRVHRMQEFVAWPLRSAWLVRSFMVFTI